MVSSVGQIEERSTHSSSLHLDCGIRSASLHNDDLDGTKLLESLLHDGFLSASRETSNANRTVENDVLGFLGTVVSSAGVFRGSVTAEGEERERRRTTGGFL